MHPLINFSNSNCVFCGSSSLWGHPVWLSLGTSLSAVWDKAMSMTNHITNLFLVERTDAEAETPILATWCKELTHLKRPWSWERLKAGGEGDDREWDGWMASLTLWTWVWVNSRSWWWTGEAWHAAVLGVTKSQTWLSDWTELNWRRNMAKNQRVHLLKPAMAGFIHSRL